MPHGTKLWGEGSRPGLPTPLLAATSGGSSLLRGGVLGGVLGL